MAGWKPIQTGTSSHLPFTPPASDFITGQVLTIDGGWSDS